MSGFLAPYLIAVVGWSVHVFVDRDPDSRTKFRVIELALLWVLVFFGAWAVVVGLGSLTGRSHETAIQVSYAPSMFQWEVGWAQVTIGMLGIGCSWSRLRDNWLTAAVVAVAIFYGGVATGHLMELVAHGNTTSNNIWAIPSGFVLALVVGSLWFAYRLSQRNRKSSYAWVSGGS